MPDPKEPTASTDSGSSQSLDDVIAGYIDRLNAGESLDPLEIVAEHPERGPARPRRGAPGGDHRRLESGRPLARLGGTGQDGEGLGGYERERGCHSRTRGGRRRSRRSRLHRRIRFLTPEMRQIKSRLMRIAWPTCAMTRGGRAPSLCPSLSLATVLM